MMEYIGSRRIGVSNSGKMFSFGGGNSGDSWSAGKSSGVDIITRCTPSLCL